jgi:ribonuclease P protein 3
MDPNRGHTVQIILEDILELDPFRVFLELVCREFLSCHEKAKSQSCHNNALSTGEIQGNRRLHQAPVLTLSNNMLSTTGVGPKRKRQSSRHIDPEVLTVRRKIQLCCSSDDLETAMATIQTALQSNIKIEAQTFYNLLNLCDGLRDKGIHVGTPRPSFGDEAVTDCESEKLETPEELHSHDVKVRTIKGPDISPQQRKVYAFIIKEHMDSQRLPLVETAYTALIRILCRTGDLDEAESILHESERCEQCKPRLRLYSPLLVAYAEKGMNKI